MQTIGFYATKLNFANRMGTFEEYNDYLGSCTRVSIDVEDNVPMKNGYFYIGDEIEDYQIFNYCLIITDVYHFTPAFCRLVPLAIGGFRVEYSIDYWCLLVSNTTYSQNIDIHGKCVRANVNDWEEYNSETNKFAKPTLKNTYLTQEENVSMSDMVRGTIANTALNIPENYAYIYVYFNNPNQAGLTYAAVGSEQTLIQTFYGSQSIYEPQLGGRQLKTLQGALACGTINLKTGFCCFAGMYKKAGSYEGITENIRECCCYLRDITNSYVTTIFISTIAPYDLVESETVYQTAITLDIPLIGEITERVYYPAYKEDYCFLLSYEHNDGSLPQKMFCPAILDTSVRFRKVNFFNSNAKYILSDETKTKTDSDYLNSIVKARSFIYNPISYCDNPIDTLHDKEVEITITADGRQFIAMIDSDILLENERIIRKNNTFIFVPDTVKDYWSILSAERTSMALTNESTNLWFGVAKSTVSGATNIAGSVGGGTAAIVGASATAAVDIASSAVNAAQKQAIIDVDKEFASAQKQNGSVSSSAPSGYYGSLLYDRTTTLSYLKLSEKSFETVLQQLHRYGYATFLLLEDVLENHKRESFNYIKCSQVELHGLDADFEQDITQMFLNGVHLWHNNNVGDFNQSNYQVSV